MAREKREKNKSIAVKKPEVDSLWRRPITLDIGDETDPLAMLYRGREVGESIVNHEASLQKTEDETTAPIPEKSKNFVKPQLTKKNIGLSDEKQTETTITKSDNRENQVKTTSRISENELKSILKIKSETFHFTDIREILRGKSIDIYAYLRFLCGEEAVCKIKHLDLMKQLDISRPTLFKQGDWLTKLSLIEKRSVPGDHLGTSYTVHRLEDILPISDVLVEQLNSHIENLRQTVK